MKICAECKYYIAPAPKYLPLCSHPAEKDFVTGGNKSCMFMRANFFKCGKRGCKWEIKKTE